MYKHHLIHLLARPINLLLLSIFTFTITSTVSLAEPAKAAFFEQWKSWFNSSPPPRRRISRGDAFCPLGLTAGTSTINLLWGDRPTLIWQGDLAKMELWSKDGKEPLWIYLAAEANPSQMIQIGGRTVYAVALPVALRPELTYEWRVYEQQDLEPMKINLQLLSASEHERITQELQQLDQTLAMTGVPAETAVIKRADYFASYDQPLWLNFWQELLSVPSPSAEISELVEATIEEICFMAN